VPIRESVTDVLIVSLQSLRSVAHVHDKVTLTKRGIVPPLDVQ
jgi:hypothetical protein